MKCKDVRNFIEPILLKNPKKDFWLEM